MIYARLFFLAVIPLALIYYIMVVLQCFGLIRFTRKAVIFPKALIPFYYFFK